VVEYIGQAAGQAAHLSCPLCSPPLGNVLEIGECFEFRADVDRNDLHEVHLFRTEMWVERGQGEQVVGTCGSQELGPLMSHFATGAGTLLLSRPRRGFGWPRLRGSCKPAPQAAGGGRFGAMFIRGNRSIPFAPAPG
jgi:hypothetical protein